MKFPLASFHKFWALLVWLTQAIWQYEILISFVSGTRAQDELGWIPTAHAPITFSAGQGFTLNKKSRIFAALSAMHREMHCQVKLSWQ